jgi:hypothetical protein
VIGPVVEVAGVAHRVGPLPAQADRPLPGGAWLFRPWPAAATEGETREAEGHGARADDVSLSETGRWLVGRSDRSAGGALVHVCHRQHASCFNPLPRAPIQAIAIGRKRAATLFRLSCPGPVKFISIVLRVVCSDFEDGSCG